MRISKKKQLQNKKRLLKVAVDLIAKKGYKKTSMSKIAKEANIGEATIYNYFPSKEHILYEYYYFLQLETKNRLLEMEEFNEFSLKEQLQTLIETELDILAEDRDFILEVYEEIFFKLFNHPEWKKGERELIDMVSELIDIAVEAGEIEEFPFNSIMQHLFTDFYAGVIYYWIFDESKNFENTTVMLDKSLDVIYALLRSGVIPKSIELFSFILKTHILSHIKPQERFLKRKFGK